MAGRAWKYGDNVDTDVIIPARYLLTGDPEELAKHCMEAIDPAFVNEVKPGDIMVGEKNFGCGSSREHAPLALRGAGISCVIAASFARIFFRNAVNIGLPVYESEEAASAIQMGDELKIDEGRGVIVNVTRNETYPFQPLPPFMQEIVAAGGLMGRLEKELAAKRGQSA